MIIVLCSLEVGPMLELNKQWLKVLTKEDFICLMMPLADFCRNWSKFRLVKIIVWMKDFTGVKGMYL